MIKISVSEATLNQAMQVLGTTDGDAAVATALERVIKTAGKPEALADLKAEMAQLGEHILAGRDEVWG